MDKLRMQTANKADENFKKLAAMFPNAVTETINENGEVVRAIDKDVLMQEISCKVVDGNEERYQFTWPDKKKSVLLANAPINRTLRPVREDETVPTGADSEGEPYCSTGSVDFDTTENLYIEGDNLEVLKLLQETYLGKIKMIYIDPPYNTGNDFVYEDDFAQNTDEYLANSGQFDKDGNRLVRNLDSNGRYHTDWLNMIYPRLKISKNLLTDDGVIFISIDDNEVKNLKNICDEIFGGGNFVSQLIWQNKKGGGNDSKHIAVEHEYILVYARNITALGEFYESYSDDYIKRYKEKDEIGCYFWDTFKRKSGKQYYPITCPDGTVLQYDEDGNPISWLRSKARFESDVKEGEIRIVKLGDKWSVQFKQRIPLGKTPRSIFTSEPVITDSGTTSSGSNDVYEYFKKDVFSNPKPVKLIQFLLGFGLQQDDIILDFFSGSATTAEAVMRHNVDGANCKYILVQVQENIDSMLYSTSANAKRVAENAISILDELHCPHIIPELAKERIRRAGAKIKEEAGLAAQNLDTGFRVLKCDTSNMKDVYYNPAEYEVNMFSRLEDNIKEDRTPEDLLFQVMLDLGVLLSSKIEETTIAGKKVFNVEDNYLIACFDSDVSEETIKAIAKQKPYYFVMRDSSMASDSVATNFDQIFATYSPETVRKVL